MQNKGFLYQELIIHHAANRWIRLQEHSYIYLQNGNFEDQLLFNFIFNCMINLCCKLCDGIQYLNVFKSCKDINDRIICHTGKIFLIHSCISFCQVAVIASAGTNIFIRSHFQSKSSKIIYKCCQWNASHFVQDQCAIMGIRLLTDWLSNWSTECCIGHTSPVFFCISFTYF